QSIRRELLYRLGGRDRRVADHIRRWLAPVWGLLAITEEDQRPAENEPSASQQNDAKKAMPLAALLALLAGPDTSPLVLEERLRSNGWARYNEKQRRRLRPVLLEHPEQLVRERAAFVLAEWHDASGLLRLVEDADFGVRKSAMYWLGELPPTPGVA